MPELRFAMLGAGFWAPFQLAGWRELDGVRCAAIYNRTRAKAEALARRFDVPAVYDDPERLLESEQIDFVDIITGADTHGLFAKLAAEHRLPVVCQKPLAASFDEAVQMVTTCRQAGVPLLVNENFRWQTPIRQLERVLNEGTIGRVFRAHVQFASSFPVFDNQPSLKELPRFILTDVGTHVLDVARFLFGEARSLYCHTQRVNPEIRGEDVATVMLEMTQAKTVVCELSYATRMEHERFPQTFVFAEGEHGSIQLSTDYWLRVTTKSGTLAHRFPPPRYDWADPAYDVVHASIVDCQRSLLGALRGDGPAETSGEDNLQTLQLVYAAYRSADEGRALDIEPYDCT